MRVTKHGEKRLKQRVRIPKKDAEDFIAEVLENGISQDGNYGTLNRYLYSLWAKEKDTSAIRVYHEKVYIFKNGALVTVMDLPFRYRAKAHKQEKKDDKPIEQEEHIEIEDDTTEMSKERTEMEDEQMKRLFNF